MKKPTKKQTLTESLRKQIVYQNERLDELKEQARKEILETKNKQLELRLSFTEKIAMELAKNSGVRPVVKGGTCYEEYYHGDL